MTDHTGALDRALAVALHTADSIIIRRTPGTDCGHPEHYIVTAWHTSRSYRASGPTALDALTAAMALLGVTVGAPEVREGAQVTGSERTTGAPGGAQ